MKFLVADVFDGLATIEDDSRNLELARERLGMFLEVEA